MSLRDLSLEKKASKRQAKVARKISQADPKANMAARTSNSVVGTKLQSDQQILDILKLVDNAATQGRYIVATKVLPASLQAIAKYFKNKNYIVATNEKKSVLVICWMGGSTWRKLEYGTNKVDSTIQAKIAESIQASVQANLDQLEPASKKIVGIAPAGEWDMFNLKRYWSKLK